jgi:hypothetical protein
MSAYANTTVAVEKSQKMVRDLLTKYGATRFAMAEEIDNAGVYWIALSFGYDDMLVRMRVPLKLDEQAIRSKSKSARTKTFDQIRQDAADQEAKRIWRVLAWNLKARLVAVEEGLETLAEAFLAHVIDPGTGQTIFESLQETGQVTLESLRLPELTASTGDGQVVS